MNYTVQRLQFGSNDLKVPNHEDDLLLLNEPLVPIDGSLVGVDSKDIWGLVFTFNGSTFYRSDDDVPAQNNTVFQCWYGHGGDSVGASFSFVPFVLDEGGGGGFVSAAHFVDFSIPSDGGSSVPMSDLTVDTVTATVHSHLPELESVTFGVRGYNEGLVLSTTRTTVEFEGMFVCYGDPVVVGNTATLQKGHGALVLAKFRRKTSTTHKDVRIIERPKIPEKEWPILISQIVEEIVAKGTHEIFKHMGVGAFMQLSEADLRAVHAAISRQATDLENLKAVLAASEAHTKK